MIDSENPGKNSQRPQTWPGLAIVIVAFVFMAALTWRKTADLIIDFGSQLYIPWQLNHGAILYRDLIYVPGGPFSQYFNALLFHFFGVSLTVLLTANLLLAFAMLVLVYRHFLKSADGWTATTVGLFVVFIFAFGHFDMGNYNYATPYSHEIFHGLILSIVALTFLANFIKTNRHGNALGSGLCYGIVFLTKPDIFIALSAALATTIFLAQKNRLNTGKFLGAFSIAALVAPAVFFCFFFRLENAHESLQSVAFAWTPLLKGVGNGYFYKSGMGLDKPLMHLTKMFVWSVGLILFLAVSAIFARQNFQTDRGKLTATMYGLILFLIISNANWLDAGYLLPPFCFVLCLMLWFGKEPNVFPLLWNVFALFLLLKMGLFSRIWNYGFVLAMPATAGLIYFLHWLLPLRLEKFGVNRRPFRWMIWLAIFIAAFQLTFQNLENYSKNTVAVGPGGDELLTENSDAEHRGRSIADALDWMNLHLPPTATLAVLPEGTTINYLSRRVNPTGCLAWSPAELKLIGQTNLNARFEMHRPDYIMLLHRSSAEFNLDYFGRQPEYGQELMQWVRQNYEIVFQKGAVPLQDNRFGLQILKRKTDSIP